jgi:hypothetical protein
MQVFEVTAVEYFETKKDETPVDLKIHLWRQPRIAETEENTRRMVERELTKDITDDALALAFLGRLKIDVSCPFPG